MSKKGKMLIQPFVYVVNTKNAKKIETWTQKQFERAQIITWKTQNKQKINVVM